MFVLDINSYKVNNKKFIRMTLCYAVLFMNVFGWLNKAL